MAGPLILLGPQRPTPNLRRALDTIRGPGPVVTITAGWRLDESETEALHAEIGPDAVHLPLYAWFEECMEQMPGVRAIYKDRQRELKTLKRMYRERLTHALDAVRGLLDRSGSHEHVVEPQLEWALEDVRRIDRQFLEQSTSIFARFDEVARPWEHASVAARRAESAALLSSARAVAIAGGHVAVLRNRMMFFGVHHQLMQAWMQQTGVVAWGAGAMLMTERIVLFYDDPPDGPSHPEILDTGLGLIRDTVLLPDARKRLRLRDELRVALLARRFAPQQCIGMENGTWLDVEDTLVSSGEPGAALALQSSGTVDALEDTL